MSWRNFALLFPTVILIFGGCQNDINQLDLTCEPQPTIITSGSTQLLRYYITVLSPPSDRSVNENGNLPRYYFSAESYSYNSEGYPIRTQQAISCGGDKKWFSEDDTWFETEQRVYSNTLLSEKVNTHRSFTLFSFDNQIDTKAEGITTYRYYYDSNNNLSRITQYFNPSWQGESSIDFFLRSYTQYNYDVNNMKNREIYYSYIGFDQQWYTADDEFSYYKNLTYNANNQLAEEITYYSPGQDNIWFTADDPAYSTISLNYDGNFRLINKIQIASATIIAYYINYEYDDSNRLVSETVINPGNDNNLFTNDDIKNFTNQYEYDSFGRKISKKFISYAYSGDAQLISSDFYYYW